MSDGPGYGPADAYHPSSAAVERTALAWQRTALALVVAAAVVGRLTLEELGPLALVGGGLAALAAAALLAVGSRPRGPVVRRGGLAPLVTTLVVATVGGLELVAVLRG